jgi:hypothetical protein
MVKTLSATVKDSGFAVTPVMKAFAVFVVLCFFSNVLVPKTAIDVRGYSALCQMIKSRPILLEFFSISILPVKILSGLLSEQRNVLSASQKKAPIGCTSNMFKGLPDLIIAGSIIQNMSLRGSAFNYGNAPAVLSGNLTNMLFGPRGNPPGLPLLELIVLIFCFMKARGALPDATDISLITVANFPRLAGTSRDFSLLAVSRSAS